MIIYVNHFQCERPVAEVSSESPCLTRSSGSCIQMCIRSV